MCETQYNPYTSSPARRAQMSPSSKVIDPIKNTKPQKIRAKYIIKIFSFKNAKQKEQKSSIPSLYRYMLQRVLWSNSFFVGYTSRF